MTEIGINLATTLCFGFFVIGLVTCYLAWQEKKGVDKTEEAMVKMNQDQAMQSRSMAHAYERYMEALSNAARKQEESLDRQ